METNGLRITLTPYPPESTSAGIAHVYVQLTQAGAVAVLSEDFTSGQLRDLARELDHAADRCDENYAIGHAAEIEAANDSAQAVSLLDMIDIPAFLRRHEVAA